VGDGDTELSNRGAPLEDGRVLGDAVKVPGHTVTGTSALWSSPSLKALAEDRSTAGSISL